MAGLEDPLQMALLEKFHLLRVSNYEAAELMHFEE
jgi:hypothetical protein